MASSTSGRCRAQPQFARIHLARSRRSTVAVPERTAVPKNRTSRSSVVDRLRAEETRPLFLTDKLSFGPGMPADGLTGQCVGVEQRYASGSPSHQFPKLSSAPARYYRIRHLFLAKRFGASASLWHLGASPLRCVWWSCMCSWTILNEEGCKETTPCKGPFVLQPQ